MQFNDFKRIMAEVSKIETNKERFNYLKRRYDRHVSLALYLAHVSFIQLDNTDKIDTILKVYLTDQKMTYTRLPEIITKRDGDPVQSVNKRMNKAKKGVEKEYGKIFDITDGITNEEYDKLITSLFISLNYPKENLSPKPTDYKYGVTENIVSEIVKSYDENKYKTETSQISTELPEITKVKKETKTEHKVLNEQTSKDERFIRPKDTCVSGMENKEMKELLNITANTNKLLINLMQEFDSYKKETDKRLASIENNGVKLLDNTNDSAILAEIQKSLGDFRKSLDADKEKTASRKEVVNKVVTDEVPTRLKAALIAYNKIIKPFDKNSMDYLNNNVSKDVIVDKICEINLCIDQFKLVRSDYENEQKKYKIKGSVRKVIPLKTEEYAKCSDNIKKCNELIKELEFKAAAYRSVLKSRRLLI